MVTVLPHMIVCRPLWLFVHHVWLFFDSGLKLLTSCKMDFFDFKPLMPVSILVCYCHLIVSFVFVFQTTCESAVRIYLHKVWFFKFFEMVLRFCPGVYVKRPIAAMLQIWAFWKSFQPQTSNSVETLISTCFCYISWKVSFSICTPIFSLLCSCYLVT